MGGIIVGTTDVLVGGTEVRVGLVRVEVARAVGEAEIGVLVAVGKASRVRSVGVAGKVDVGVGVRVTVGVGVGMVEVIVGGSEGVYVGAVDVGKGPSSAFAVSARAVLVLLALCTEPNPLAGSLKANQKYRITPSSRALIPTACRSTRRCIMFNVNNSFLQANKKR